MKLRVGFVSNSSSSSYLLYIPEKESEWSVKFRHFWQYVMNLRDICSDDSHLEHYTKSDYIAQYDWDPEYQKKVEEELKQYPDDSVKELRIAYQDHLLEDLIEYFIGTGELVAIRDKEEA